MGANSEIIIKTKQSSNKTAVLFLLLQISETYHAILNNIFPTNRALAVERCALPFHDPCFQLPLPYRVVLFFQHQYPQAFLLVFLPYYKENNFLLFLL